MLSRPMKYALGAVGAGMGLWWLTHRSNTRRTVYASPATAAATRDTRAEDGDTMAGGSVLPPSGRLPGAASPPATWAPPPITAATSRQGNAALSHVPQVEDALGENAMGIDADVSREYAPRHARHPPLHRSGGGPGGPVYESPYGGVPPSMVTPGPASSTSARGGGYEPYYGWGTGVDTPARASKAMGVVADHATAAKEDVAQGGRELDAVSSTHADLAKRDVSTAMGELKQALVGDQLPGRAVVRDTPDLTTSPPRDQAVARPTRSYGPPSQRQDPTIMDRLAEAKDIVAEHGAAAARDVAQWGRETKAVASGHRDAANVDVANEKEEVKGAMRGADVQPAPMRAAPIRAATAAGDRDRDSHD